MTMPDWRDEVSAAVRAWLGTIRSGARSPTWRPIGTARPEGQGWFVVDLRGARQTQTSPEELETLRIWAPWTGSRTDTVLPLLKATVERGVQVNIFTRPERAQSRESWRERLRELREIVPRVVAYANMHQKIVVVDRRITLLGSLNPLSHRDTREVMVEHEGLWFATSLLQHEHAEHFANPPECDVCKATAELRRAIPDDPRPPWSWRCGVRGWLLDEGCDAPRAEYALSLRIASHVRRRIAHAPSDRLVGSKVSHQVHQQRQVTDLPLRVLQLGILRCWFLL